MQFNIKCAIIERTEFIPYSDNYAHGIILSGGVLWTARKNHSCQRIIKSQ